MPFSSSTNQNCTGFKILQKLHNFTSFYFIHTYYITLDKKYNLKVSLKKVFFERKIFVISLLYLCDIPKNPRIFPYFVSVTQVLMQSISVCNVASGHTQLIGFWFGFFGFGKLQMSLTKSSWDSTCTVKTSFTENSKFKTGNKAISIRQE